MAQSTTLILLPQTPYNNPGSGAPYTVYGNSQPAAGYYLASNDLQTVNISLTEVTGNVIIEATLATEPGDLDWFSVYELDANNWAPTGTPLQTDSTISTYTNIIGNFVYMRAVVKDFQYGVVNYIKLSY
jgi:hypothetical protein